MLGALATAAPAAAFDPLAIRIQDASCVADNCTVRLEVENQSQDDLGPLMIRCEARYGLEKVAAQSETPIERLYAGERRTVRLGIDVPARSTPPNHVACELLDAEGRVAASDLGKP